MPYYRSSTRIRSPRLPFIRPFVAATAAALVLSLSISVPALAIADAPDKGAATVNGTVWAVAHIGDTLYIGGEFTQIRVGGKAYAVKNLAAIDALTGKPKPDWDPRATNPDNAGTVYSLAASPDGKRVYAGGQFVAIDGDSHRHVAALDATSGQALAVFDARVDFNVWAIAAAGSKVFIGGDFRNVNGSPRVHLAALEPDGDLVPGWNGSTEGQGTLWNGRVRALATSPDGQRLYVGGDFSKLSGCNQRDLGAVATGDGDCIGAFDPVIDQQPSPKLGQHIFDLVIGPSSVVYAAVGGDLNRVDGFRPADGKRVMRVGANGDPQALAIKGPKLYVGGHFTKIGAKNVSKLALVNVGSKTVKPSWSPALNTFFAVWALEMRAGDLWVGGEFTQVNGKARPHLAVFRSPNTVVPGKVGIGDQAMRSAEGRLRKAGYSTVDAENGRKFPKADDRVRSLRADGLLRKHVVIHLGNNGPVTPAACDAAVKAAGKKREVWLVTVTKREATRARDNERLAACARRHPNAHRLDWYTYSRSHDAWFQGDHITLTALGAQKYVGFLKTRVG